MEHEQRMLEAQVDQANHENRLGQQFAMNSSNLQYDQEEDR